MTNVVVAVDIFCGVGGLSYGLKQAGITIVAGVDNDEKCKYPFEKNVFAKFIHEDVSKLKSRNISKLYPPNSHRVLVGCAPCQSFSPHTNKATKKDEQWGLLYDFGELVKKIKPDVVSMENVVPIRNSEVFADFLGLLYQMDYNVSVSSVFCPDYGVPQKRRRLVLLGSKHGEIELIPPTHKPDNYVVVQNAIGNLPPITDGEISEIDPLHRSWTMNKLNKKRIKSSKPGGTWESWPNNIKAECHRKKSGASYKSVYSRMEWDKPSPTITTQFYNFGTGRFGHPEQDRAISLREGAILQTFPPHYLFSEDESSITFSHVGRLIGNAVPVKLGEAIGKSIIEHLNAGVAQ